MGDRSIYPGGVRGSGGNPSGRPRARRPRGNIEALASGSLRVRVYAGVDVVTGRDLYLKQTVPAGPDVFGEALRVQEELVAAASVLGSPRPPEALGSRSSAPMARLRDQRAGVG